jgi:hypothetical protein
MNKYNIIRNDNDCCVGEAWANSEGEAVRAYSDLFTGYIFQSYFCMHSNPYKQGVRAELTEGVTTARSYI